MLSLEIPNNVWSVAEQYRIFKRPAKALIRLRVCAGWSELLLVAHTHCSKSHVVAHMCFRLARWEENHQNIETDYQIYGKFSTKMQNLLETISQLLKAILVFICPIKINSPFEEPNKCYYVSVLLISHYKSINELSFQEKNVCMPCNIRCSVKK